MATGATRPWDAVYASTRPSLLAAATNPFFFSGSAGEGIGGPHVGWNMAWPMAITVLELLLMRTDERMAEEAFIKKTSLVSTTAADGWCFSPFYSYLISLP